MLYDHHRLVINITIDGPVIYVCMCKYILSYWHIVIKNAFSRVTRHWRSCGCLIYSCGGLYNTKIRQAYHGEEIVLIFLHISAYKEYCYDKRLKYITSATGELWICRTNLLLRSANYRQHFAIVLWIYLIRRWNILSTSASIMHCSPSQARYVCMLCICWEHMTGRCEESLTTRFMGPTWGPHGVDRTQVVPMLAPWTLLSGIWFAWQSSLL